MAEKWHTERETGRFYRGVRRPDRCTAESGRVAEKKLSQESSAEMRKNYEKIVCKSNRTRIGFHNGICIGRLWKFLIRKQWQ